MSQPKTIQSSDESTKPSLCAVFDFDTFILNSELLTDEQLSQRRSKLPPNQVITNNAIQEYTNERKHITITLITIPPECMEKLTMMELRCLAKTTSLYIENIKDKKSAECFIRFSTFKPKKANSNYINSKKYGEIINYSSKGMVFAIIFRTFPGSARFLVTGIYYHGYSSVPHVPNFGEREKDKRISNVLDVFVADTDNAISSTKSLKKYVSKSKKKKRKKRRKSVERRSSKSVRICETDLEHKECNESVLMES